MQWHGIFYRFIKYWLWHHKVRELNKTGLLAPNSSIIREICTLTYINYNVKPIREWKYHEKVASEANTKSCERFCLQRHNFRNLRLLLLMPLLWYSPHRKSSSVPSSTDNKNKNSNKSSSSPRRQILGVVRLDGYPLSYDGGAYEPLPGDIDSPQSYHGYDVKFAIAKDCTWDAMRTPDEWTAESMARMRAGLHSAIEALEKDGCSGFTADCGLFILLQNEARNFTSRPVFLSSLVMLPLVFASLSPTARVVVLTSNGACMRSISKSSVLTDPLGNSAANRLVVCGLDEQVGVQSLSLSLLFYYNLFSSLIHPSGDLPSLITSSLLLYTPGHRWIRGRRRGYHS